MDYMNMHIRKYNEYCNDTIGLGGGEIIKDLVLKDDYSTIYRVIFIIPPVKTSSIQIAIEREAQEYDQQNDDYINTYYTLLNFYNGKVIHLDLPFYKNGIVLDESKGTADDMFYFVQMTYEELEKALKVFFNDSLADIIIKDLLLMRPTE